MGHLERQLLDQSEELTCNPVCDLFKTAIALASRLGFCFGTPCSGAKSAIAYSLKLFPGTECQRSPYYFKEKGGSDSPLLVREVGTTETAMDFKE